MRRLSIVIPALNEAENIPKVLATIPRAKLAVLGWDSEVIVVDNASTDGTGDIAESLGARVVLQPDRGYGNAYKAGFVAATGDVVATGDADCTYPFDALGELLYFLEADHLDFLSTNRLIMTNRVSLKPSHRVGNRLLTGASRTFFRSPFRDSQSGMWVFKRSIWSDLDVRATGMAFSQEIKHEAYLKGYRCGEVSIEYRQRGGVVKLNAGRDGVINVSQLVSHRLRGRRDVLGFSDAHRAVPAPQLAIASTA